MKGLLLAVCLCICLVGCTKVVVVPDTVWVDVEYQMMDDG